MKKYTHTVVIAYECRLGKRGDIVSKHSSYELARTAAKRSGFDSFLAIREIN